MPVHGLWRRFRGAQPRRTFGAGRVAASRAPKSPRLVLGSHRAFSPRYKKNLKALYIVHPTSFIKVLWNVFKPLIRYAGTQTRARAHTRAPRTPAPRDAQLLSEARPRFGAPPCSGPLWGSRRRFQACLVREVTVEEPCATPSTHRARSPAGVSRREQAAGGPVESPLWGMLADSGVCGQ